jgi:type I restriction enzyme M protein
VGRWLVRRPEVFPPARSQALERVSQGANELGLVVQKRRTNQHFTLKEKTLKRTDLDEFVQCFHPENRHERTESERFKCYSYDELLKRDKVNLDIFWLKDESLEDSANLPDPDVLALEIAEEPKLRWNSLRRSQEI